MAPPRSRSGGDWPQLARTAQVLVVTHLPQVAAYADRHVLVEKSDDGSVTSSGLSVLDDESRERELSRMLAGLADSDTALAHARELLTVAREARARVREGPGDEVQLPAHPDLRRSRA